MKNSHFLSSVKYATFGFKIAYRERNFRWEIFAMLAVIFFGFLFSVTVTEWLIIIALIGAVLALECINTAIEIITDCLLPFHNPKARAIKDVSACAVFIMSLASAVVGIIIFFPYFFAVLK